MITVEIPRALIVRLEEEPVIELPERCASVREALDALAHRSPGLVDRILDEQGEVRRHVNVFVDDDDIRQLRGLDTPLGADSRIHLLASVSGG